MQTSQPSSTARPAPIWSKLGFGTGTLASLGRAAAASEVEILLETMLGIGATVIDTADSYGSGDCEYLLGKVLRGRRESFTLVTKAGYRLSNLRGPLRPLNQFVKKGIQRLGYRQHFESSYLRKCLDHSLSRLGMEQVDAFLLHDPPLESVRDESVIQTCVDLIKSGKTNLTGISSGDLEVLRSAIESGVFRVIQTPASLKSAVALRPIWQECESRGIHVIGNHVFDPACLDFPGMTHEKLMRGSSALLPKSSTILCGTRNSAHLHQANEWAKNPFSKTEEDHLVQLLHS
jgi:aryl-alcohol dehydrogenase-like predicted oxidoreductase